LDLKIKETKEAAETARREQERILKRLESEIRAKEERIAALEKQDSKPKEKNEKEGVTIEGQIKFVDEKTTKETKPNENKEAKSEQGTQNTGNNEAVA
jgi:acyl-CoA reductase-like NAD-dependent aldehyde dehydrogenase